MNNMNLEKKILENFRKKFLEVGNSVAVIRKNDMNNFISSALKEVREQTKKEILEKLPKEIKTKNYLEGDEAIRYANGHNSCLKEIIYLIKNL
jgi:ribosomal protein L10